MVLNKQGIVARVFLPATLCFLLLVAAVGFASPQKQMTADEKLIRQLNEQYVEAFLKADVGWYQRHLSDDFVCIESSGAVLNKQEFLKNTEKGPDVPEYKLDKVDVRFYGNTALVQATGLFKRKDGSPGASRYIDIYVRMGHEWKVVSAQITRVASPAK